MYKTPSKCYATSSFRRSKITLILEVLTTDYIWVDRRSKGMSCRCNRSIERFRTDLLLLSTRPGTIVERRRTTHTSCFFCFFQWCGVCSEQTPSVVSGRGTSEVVTTRPSTALNALKQRLTERFLKNEAPACRAVGSAPSLWEGTLRDSVARFCRDHTAAVLKFRRGTAEQKQAVCCCLQSVVLIVCRGR